MHQKSRKIGVRSYQRDNIKKIDISKSPEKSGLSLCQKLKNKHFFE
jgi:hypothetical protein